jgi:hypothetical protein
MHEMTKIEASIAFCGFFEAELLTSLMLRYWQPPQAADADYVNHLLETAAEVLNRSQAGEKFFSDVEPEDMNLAAAIWYAEFCQLSGDTSSHMEQRKEWLTKVRHALPSCFCDPEQLPDS